MAYFRRQSYDVFLTPVKQSPSSKYINFIVSQYNSMKLWIHINGIMWSLIIISVFLILEKWESTLWSPQVYGLLRSGEKKYVEVYEIFNQQETVK